MKLTLNLEPTNRITEDPTAGMTDEQRREYRCVKDLEYKNLGTFFTGGKGTQAVMMPEVLQTMCNAMRDNTELTVVLLDAGLSTEVIEDILPMIDEALCSFEQPTGDHWFVSAWMRNNSVAGSRGNLGFSCWTGKEAMTKAPEKASATRTEAEPELA